MLAGLALRNLARNGRRTALELMVVGAGAASLLLTTGYVRDSFNGIREAFVRGGLCHLEVAPVAGSDAGAGPDRASPPSFDGWIEARRTIEAMPHVAGAMGAILMHGLVAKDERTLPFVGAGVEPDREERMGLRITVRSGELLPSTAPVEGEETVLLGLGLARQLGASVGDVVTLTVFSRDGMLNALDARVAGLVTTGVQELDLRFLRVHLAAAQRLLTTDAVSSVLVMLDDAQRTGELQTAIGHRVGPRLAVTDWQARAPFYVQVRALYWGIFTFLGSVVLMLVCLSSSNTLLMSVMERTREMGALLAIGTSASQLVRMIMYEAVWLGLIGGLLGCGVGFVAAAVIHALNVQLPPPPGAVEPMQLQLQLLAWDPVWITGLMITILAASAVMPAWRVLRLRIIDALSHA